MGCQESQRLRKKAASWSSSMAAEVCLRGGRWQQGEPAVTELDVIWSYPLGSPQVFNKVRGQYEPPPAESARLGFCIL